MRVLVTGAGGIIGKELVNSIIEKYMQPENMSVEYLIAVDSEGIVPVFNNDSTKEWVTKNLWEADNSWWSLVIDKEIDTIYYLETTENINIYEPTYEVVSKIRMSDILFMNFLRNIFVNPEAKKINLALLSTEKLYYRDKFPNELNTVCIGPEEHNSVINLYAASKLMIETELLTVISSVTSRIIRPISIVSPEQGQEWPLTSLVIKAFQNETIYIYADGKRGFSFTHVKDLIKFLISDKLFNKNIENSLTSRIINFCRVWNYLPENYLIDKIINKTESKSEIIRNSEYDLFPYNINTPQIRNMVKIDTPVIPIEIIIEELYYKLNPTVIYADLIILDAGYTTGLYFKANGTAEPNSSIVVELDTGEMLSTVTDQNGNWNVITEEPMAYTDWQTIIFYATINNIQYQTKIQDIPPAPLP